MSLLGTVLWVMPLAATAAAPETRLLPLNSVDSVTQTWGRKEQPHRIEVATGAENTTDGDGALRLAARTAPDGQDSQYYGAMIRLPEPLDLRQARLLLDVRSAAADRTSALYIRLYNEGQAKPCWSFNSWSTPLRSSWQTLSLQAGTCLAGGLTWEPKVVEDRVADRADRLELIIGTRTPAVDIELLADNLRLGPALTSLANIRTPKRLVRETVLVHAREARAAILHPDSPVGKEMADLLAATVRDRTGTALSVRVATPQDRQPDQAVILLGNVDSNPALQLLYARYLTPVDAVCPGTGGALVHTVHDPFGKGVNAVVVGAADDAGLRRAADVLRGLILQQPQGADLALPRIFERGYSDEFLKRFSWAGAQPSPDRVEAGLTAGRRALAEGRHTSLAGELATVAQRYALTASSAEAQLFVSLWDLYVDSAKADPRKYGGPWGFDSDFPSAQVVCGWDTIEEDPALTDEERLRVTQALGRWLTEAVIPKCAGAATSSHVPHNHQTFPGLGALFAGLYLCQSYDAIEGHNWLGLADAMFRRQARYFKPYEDCNGYQWLTNGHLMRYALARPDPALFENGNGRRIIDYCLGTMNNLGYQAPYGDTGTWQCWNSEMICLDAYAFATGDATATWAAALKRRLKNTLELYSFYRSGEGQHPDTAFSGVRVWPLEPAYLTTFPDASGPAAERCFDKISFREALAPEAAYLLLDGLSNGGHKHLDGNSLIQLTQFGRIWLADNDYFKAPVKYHNSVMVFRDGQSAPIPAYTELVAAGETPRYGFSRTRLSDYAGVDWDRTVVWLKHLHAFVVLDRLQARTSDEYQFRVLWHGVGAAELTDDGLRLSQNGPSLWLQVGPGPALSLTNDEELGENWKGYPHADPVVRSLRATSTVRLEAGQSYLFATALHGTPEGTVEPWRIQYLADLDGVLVSAGPERFGLVLGPCRGQTTEGLFDTDAAALAVDPTGISLLTATRTTVDDSELQAAVQPQTLDIPEPNALPALVALPLRPPGAGLSATAVAPAHPVLWQQRPSPECLVLSGNTGLPGAITGRAVLQSEPQPTTPNVFNPKAPNTLACLVDGKWGNDTTTCVMYPPDMSVTLTLDLGLPCRIARVRWFQWWSTTSSQNTAYLLGKATVAVSQDGFVADNRELGVVTDDGPHPNFGSPLEYQVRGGAEPARWVRLTLVPKPGTAVYLAEFLVEGLPAEGEVADIAPLRIMRLATAKLGGPTEPADVLVATAEGALVALRADGSRRWQLALPCRLNDLAAADLDGDGRDEIVVARQDCRVSVLDAEGKELWQRELAYYRRPPYVNVVRTGDLDGDGRPEVIAGGENWRFYAFKADGTELWNYESVHPSRSGAVADLDGDGKAEVICGTHYYWMSVLNPDGTRRWGYNMGPICYDIATGAFDGDKTRGVVFGGGDGYLHVVDSTGKPRLQYNTGDEVRQVATADLDGDGKDEILAGSMSHSLYCFDARGTRRWRTDLGSPITALACGPLSGAPTVVAGTQAGLVLSLDPAGRVLASTDLGAAVVDIVPHDGAAVVATADGRLRRLRARPGQGGD